MILIRGGKSNPSNETQTLVSCIKIGCATYLSISPDLHVLTLNFTFIKDALLPARTLALDINHAQQIHPIKSFLITAVNEDNVDCFVAVLQLASG